MPYNDNKNINIFNNGNYEKSPVKVGGFFLLSEAAEKCSYTQEYLSLLARRGELKAKKIGRNWYTNMEWLAEYISAHPADRKGNVKGALKNDTNYDQLIQASPLIESLDDYIRAVKERLVDAAENLNGKINNIFFKTARRWRAVSVLSRIKSRWFKISQKSREESEVEQRHLAIIQSLEKFKTGYESDLVSLIEKLLPARVWKKIKIQPKLYYPFAAGANKFILESAEELVLGSVGMAPFNPIKHCLQLIKNQLAGCVYAIKVAVIDFWREPIILIRHWPALNFGFRVRVTATSLAMMAMIVWCGLSLTDGETAVMVYDKTARAVDFGAEQTVKLVSRAIEPAVKIYELRDKFYARMDLDQASGMAVAGLSTIDLSNVFKSAVWNELNNANRAVENLVNQSLGEEQGRQRMEITGMAKRGLKLMAIKLNQAERRMEREMGNGWLSGRSGQMFEVLSNGFIRQIMEWPGVKIRSEQIAKLVSLIEREGEERQLAARNYIARFPGRAEERLVEEKIREWGRLGALASQALAIAKQEWREFQPRLDKFLGRTKNNLGNGYLALLEALNLEPRYTDYGTGRTLPGKGYEPLELTKGPIGLEDHGLAIVPLGENTDSDSRDNIARKIQDTFSDEVEVAPDEDTATGMIRPKDKELAGEDYMYVFVPIK